MPFQRTDAVRPRPRAISAPSTTWSSASWSWRSSSSPGSAAAASAARRSACATTPTARRPTRCNPTRVKLRAFALAGGIAGLGGALLAGACRPIPLDRFFTVDDSLLLVSIVVIGGLGSVAGPDPRRAVGHRPARLLPRQRPRAAAHLERRPARPPAVLPRRARADRLRGARRAARRGREALGTGAGEASAQHSGVAHGIGARAHARRASRARDATDVGVRFGGIRRRRRASRSRSAPARSSA